MSTVRKKGIGYCTAKTSDGAQCDCREYDDPDIQQPGQPVVCRECCHGRSLHNGVSAPAVVSSDSMVNDIVSTLLRDSQNSAAVKAARSETNAGLQGGSSKQDISIGNKTAKALALQKNASSSSSNRSGSSSKVGPTTKVGNIIWVTCGIIKRKLLTPKAPGSREQQELEGRGLAITSGSSQKTHSQEMHDFGNDWGPKKINAVLREKMPKVFDLFAESHPWVLTLDDDDSIPLEEDLPYQHLVKESHSLRVLPHTKLTSSRIMQNRGPSGTAIRHSYLWLATRDTYSIPDAEFGGNPELMFENHTSSNASEDPDSASSQDLTDDGSVSEAGTYKKKRLGRPRGSKKQKRPMKTLRRSSRNAATRKRPREESPLFMASDSVDEDIMATPTISLKRQKRAESVPPSSTPIAGSSSTPVATPSSYQVVPKWATWDDLPASLNLARKSSTISISSDDGVEEVASKGKEKENEEEKDNRKGKGKGKARVETENIWEYPPALGLFD